MRNWRIKTSSSEAGVFPQLFAAFRFALFTPAGSAKNSMTTTYSVPSHPTNPHAPDIAPYLVVKGSQVVDWLADADMAAYYLDPANYTQSLGCWDGFIAQQNIISIKKHFSNSDRRYLYLSGWMVEALRSEFDPLPISRCTRKRACRRSFKSCTLSFAKQTPVNSVCRTPVMKDDEEDRFLAGFG